MSDTMPERVWLKSYPGIGPRTAASHEHGAIAYVPEQRALLAEEASRARYGAWKQAESECAHLRTQVDALRADLKALVPLARYWLAYLDLEPTLSDTAETIAARAILDWETP